MLLAPPIQEADLKQEPSTPSHNLGGLLQHLESSRLSRILYGDEVRELRESQELFGSTALNLRRTQPQIWAARNPLSHTHNAFENLAGSMAGQLWEFTLRSQPSTFPFAF